MRLRLGLHEDGLTPRKHSADFCLRRCPVEGKTLVEAAIVPGRNTEGRQSFEERNLLRPMDSVSLQQGEQHRDVVCSRKLHIGVGENGLDGFFDGLLGMEADDPVRCNPVQGEFPDDVGIVLGSVQELECEFS